MANSGSSSVKIIDHDGDVVAVTDNALDVNIAGGTSIDIGDVDIHLSGNVPLLGNAGAVAAGVLRVTLASDDPAVASLDEIESAIEAIEKEEDAQHVSGNKGIMSLAVRNDTLTSLVSHEHDYAPLQVDAEGGLYVNIDNSLVKSGISWSLHYGMLSHGLRNDVLDAVSLVDDGEYTLFQMNAKGALYVTGGEVENAAVQSEPLLIGGRYDSSARTLGSGDAGAVALNASGHVLMDVVDGGQLDTVIDTLETTLTAIETDQAAIKALLITIDSDTDAIKTAVEILDDAVYADDGDFTLNSSKGVAIMGFYGTQNITPDDVGVLKCTGAGLLAVDVASISATITVDTITEDVSIADGGNSITVDGQVGHDITGILSDDNPTVGTSAEAITTDGADGAAACKRMDIMAHPSNVGEIWVGDAAITTNGLNGGIRLLPGDFYSIDIDNTGDIYVVATVDGENVCYNYYT